MDEITFDLPVGASFHQTVIRDPASETPQERKAWEEGRWSSGRPIQDYIDQIIRSLGIPPNLAR